MLVLNHTRLFTTKNLKLSFHLETQDTKKKLTVNDNREEICKKVIQNKDSKVIVISLSTVNIS